jgi:hypothetical protein
VKSLLAYAAASALLLPIAAAPAEPSPATGPVDDLTSSPDNFKLLLENDHARGCNIRCSRARSTIGTRTRRASAMCFRARRSG